MKKYVVKFARWTLNSLGIDLVRVEPISLSSRIPAIRAKLFGAKPQPALLGATFLGEVPISTVEILKSLRALGVEQGDHLLVHSSLKAFHVGAKEGSPFAAPSASTSDYARDLIEMFKAAVGSTGALMFPTDFMGDYLVADGRGSLFSLKSAKSNRGFLTEVFRTYPGVIRSTHPVYNCAVLGGDYRTSLANHWNFKYVMEPGTPWRQFADAGGKIIFFGTNLDCNSMIHAPEYELKQEYPRPVFFGRTHKFQIEAIDGEIRSVEGFLHAIRWSPGTVTKFCNYLSRKYGIYRSTTICGVPITVVSAKDQYNALMSELRDGISWYDAEYDSKF